jgi:hypothetical protein
MFGPQRDHVFRQDALMREEHSATAETAVKEPKTPIKKRAQNHWHGLPSPETPNFHKTPSVGFSIDSLNRLTSTDVEGNNNKLQHLFLRASQYLGDDTSPDRLQAAVNGLQRSSAEPRSTLPDIQATDVEVNDDTDIEATGDVTIRDAMLAQELGAELGSTTTRRSTRLRNVPKPTCKLSIFTSTDTYAYSLLSSDAPQLSVTAPRIVRSKPGPPKEQETPTQPEFSNVPCKSDPILFEGLPTVHSLSWQLQYPPGGSTHPSYPYPLMDPRLIFHQPFVPVVDGLPDFTRVPKLVLPMGWKHVSWAGLLPIAFDPYCQAFKLTPIGPMPLTCEELRQGGLHKYVPSGELHPEFGMLPDMLKLSDGSDAEIFDFEGVDWTLPWEGHMGFHATAAYGTDFQHTTTDTSTPSPTSNSVNTILYPWKAERDCPNQVFDLADAWRWLTGKEVNSTADFDPTPKKSWKGTGAARTTHKFKYPIAELMMLAKLPNPDDPDDAPMANPILRNQDTSGRTEKNAFCPFRSVATPMYVDITLLDDTEFTLVELISYFPQHFNWGHAAERLSKADVKPSAIRDLINATRMLEGETAITTGRISSNAIAARKRDLPQTDVVDIDEVGKDTPTPASKPGIIDMTTTYTAEDWVYNVWQKIDYPVLALAHGLQALPSGPDAGPLTALILWCRKQGRYEVLVSEVPALLKEAGIEPLIEPGEAGCPDKEVVARHADAMKKDRRRVLRTLGEKKRALEGQDEGKSKRRKASE